MNKSEAMDLTLTHERSRTTPSIAEYTVAAEAAAAGRFVILATIHPSLVDRVVDASIQWVPNCCCIVT